MIKSFSMRLPVLVFLSLLLPDLSFAQAGLLDSSFAVNGIAVSNFQTGVSLALQDDGKILVGGVSESGFFAVTRYNVDGTLDASFGSNGIVDHHIGWDDNPGGFIAIQADGKIIVSGISYNNLGYSRRTLIRMKPDGNLDNTFNGNGRIIIDEGGGFEVAISSGGQILQAGQLQDFAITAVTENGTIDNQFGSNGVVETYLGGMYSNPNAMIIQQDGKIVLAGATTTMGVSSGYTGDFAVARYHHDGILDSSFSNDGKALFQFPTPYFLKDASCNDFVLQPDGKYVLIGNASSHTTFPPTYSPVKIATARLTPDGELDPLFGDNGMILESIPGFSGNFAFCMALQPDGKLLQSGVVGAFDTTFLRRCFSDGTVDSGFANLGYVLFPGNGGTDITIQSDGKILLLSATESGYQLRRFYSGLNTSIDNTDNKHLLIHVNPNPFTNVFQISATGVAAHAEYEVVNVLGQRVRQAVLVPVNQFVHASVDFSSSAPGVYIVRLFANGKQYQQKVVKQ